MAVPNIRVVSVMEASTVTGPAKNLIQFAKRAASADPHVDLSIVTFYRQSDNGSGTNQFIETARSEGIEVDVVPERRRFDVSVLDGLRDVLAKRDPDIVQTHGIKAHFLMRLLRRHASRPYWIAFHHGYTTENLKMRAYNSLNRWSLPAVDRVITVCGPFKDVVARDGVRSERIVVLPNSINIAPPVDASKVDALRASLELDSAPVLVAIGRFSSEKGHADLVKAAALLKQQQHRFRVVLVGDGVERKAVERAVADGGLETEFRFVGHQRDVRPYYALADIFVLPSHSEGSPNALLEAMAEGVPVVATSVGGVPETVEHERSALLVAPRKPDELAAAIGRLLSDPNEGLRLSANARADIEQHFTPDAYRRSLTAVYQELCDHECLKSR